MKSKIMAVALGMIVLSVTGNAKAENIYSIISAGIVPVDGRFTFYKTDRATGETFACQTGGKWKPVCRQMLAPIVASGPADRFEAKFVPEVQATAIVVDNQVGTVWLCPSNGKLSNGKLCERQETAW